jgi:predicted phage terminase large subunit-like protein
LPAVAAEQARRSLARFIRDSWHVLEPTTPLVWNWHIEAVAWHVQAVLEDWQRRQADSGYTQRLRNLLINIPPGTAKSRIVSVCTPAWMWLRCPEWRAIFLSSNPDVALRDSIYCRDLIESDWYQESFRPTWRMKGDQNAKGLYCNTAGGFRQARGWFAKITGNRADALFVDDPHDADEAQSDKLRQSVLDRWDAAIGNRLNDLRTSVRIGIMQRLHERDFSGHVMAQGDWELLCLPQEFEEAQARTTALGWRDPRTKEGELLFEERFPPEVLATERRRLGSYGYAGQHQQRPAPAEGGILKRKWWRFWQLPGQTLPPVLVRQTDGSFYSCPVVTLPGQFGQTLQSWDMAFKDTKDSAFVVGQVWGRTDADKWLLDQVREKLDFVATLAAVQELSRKWPHVALKLVEDKANGPAVISSLKSRVSGLVAVEPEGGKEARAQAVAPAIESGNVYLPHPSLAAWVDGFINECAAFPNGAYADQVDAMSQALRRMEQGGFGYTNFRR